MSMYMYNLFIRVLLPRRDPPSFVWKGEVPPTPPPKMPPFISLVKETYYLLSSYSSVYWICFQLFFVCIVHKLTLDTRAKNILFLLNVSTGWQWRSGFNKWHFNDNYPLTAGTSLNWTLLARLVWHFYQALVIQSSSTRYSYSRIQSIKPIQMTHA